MSDLVVNSSNNSGRLYAAGAVVLLVLCFIIPEALNVRTEFFPIIGGVIGALSSLFVTVGYMMTPKDRSPPLELLIWRSFCDLGLAVRFIATTGFNYYVCGAHTCTMSGHPNDADKSGCGVAAAMFEFFEMASEAWFLCIGLDLYFSMTYPFSSLQSRLKYYHLFAWTFATVYAIPTLVDSNIYGYWYINEEADNAVVCWIRIDNHVSWRPSVMFYIPLAVIYFTCFCILVLAYNRLKGGIPRTIMHRMKVLILNSVNITLYSAYWFILAIAYIGSYTASYKAHNYHAGRFLYRVLLFMISAKGFSSLLVWITATNLYLNTAQEQDNERLDLNNALRQEILHYATKGIRCCTKDASFDKKVTMILDQQVGNSGDMTLSNLLTAWFFVKLAFGMQKQIKEINDFIHKSGKQYTPRANGDDDMGMNSNNNNLNRLSTRDTVSLMKVDSRSSSMHTDEEGIALEGVNSAAKSPKTSANNNNNTNNTNNSVGSRASVRLSEQIDEDDNNIQIVRDEDNLTIFDEIKQTFRQFTGSAVPYVEFTEFEPKAFRRIRESAGVTDTSYIDAFRTTLKERLTEGGASGAFFFFSKGEMFIAKSCTPEEVEILSNNAKRFADYFSEQRNSYISKIFGAYRLRIYSTSLHFFVMNNLFLISSQEGNTIHEKYDIKGSWVARNASLPKDGQMVNCSYCEQRFVYRRKYKLKKMRKLITSTSKESSNLSKDTSGHVRSPLSVFKTGLDDDSNQEDDYESCPYTVNGVHSPNVVLKDNDLKYKIRLSVIRATQLLEQLRRDADFLLSIGVMDYSLLVGVHNTDYEVNPDMSNPNPNPNPIHDNNNNNPSSPKDRSRSVNHAAVAGGQQGAPGGTSDSQRMRAMTSHSLSPNELMPGTTRLKVSRVVGPESYYVGIIDYQQKWNFNKKLERFFKINFKGADPDGLSAIEPRQYRDRFVKHIEDILELDDNKPKSTSPEFSNV